MLEGSFKCIAIDSKTLLLGQYEFLAWCISQAYFDVSRLQIGKDSTITIALIDQFSCWCKLSMVKRDSPRKEILCFVSECRREVVDIHHLIYLASIE